MTTSKTVWADLLVALLAVYSIKLEKVDALTPAFDKQGLTDPHKLSKMNYEAIHEALCKSGYDRGNLMGIFVPRVQALAEYLTAKGIAESKKILESKDKIKIKEFLTPIKGIGPKAMEYFFLLRGLE